MFENSDEILKSYLDKNPQEIEYYQKYHKYKNDPTEVTKTWVRNLTLYLSS